MSYFAAVLARADDEWVAAEVDLDEVESLDDVAEQARKALAAEEPDADDDLMVVLMEQRDEWFGVVRVDLDEDPRVFVSDAAAALRHALGETLLPDLVVPPPADVDEVVAGIEDADPPEADEDDAAEDAVPVVVASTSPEREPLDHPSGPTGDSGVLADLGLGSAALLDLASSGEAPPSEVLDDLAERMGAASAFELVR